MFPRQLNFMVLIGIALYATATLGAAPDEPQILSLLPRDHLPDCDSGTSKGDDCLADPATTHPTQFAVGLRDVYSKRAKIAKIKNSPDELKDYLKNNKIRAIKGTGGVFYIIDGHHRSRALAEENVHEVYITVIEDFSHLTNDSFWRAMLDHHFVWPFDENGNGPLNPALIPDSVSRLKDDPYRALAEDAMNLGAYEQTDMPFQQFIWANYYRSRIEKILVTGDYDQALRVARKISHDPGASELPGFKKSSPSETP